MNHPYEKIGVSLPHSRTLEHQDMKELFVKNRKCIFLKRGYRRTEIQDSTEK